jgi:hypothetical protein
MDTSEVDRKCPRNIHIWAPLNGNGKSYEVAGFYQLPDTTAEQLTTAKQLLTYLKKYVFASPQDFTLRLDRETTEKFVGQVDTTLPKYLSNDDKQVVPTAEGHYDVGELSKNLDYYFSPLISSCSPLIEVEGETWYWLDITYKKRGDSELLTRTKIRELPAANVSTQTMFIDSL